MIVPAYNAAATLAETLATVAAQTYRNLEILIVDDGSTDATAGIALAFCAQEPRARLIAKRNGGVASSRNLGIREARGEYVAPVDADDLWHPTKLARQVAAAESAAGPLGFVYCGFRDIDEQGAVLRDGEFFDVPPAGLQQLLYRNYVGNGSALLIRRSAAVDVGGYDERLRASGAEGCEDILLQLRLASRYTVVGVPAFLVGYRSRPGSMSQHPWRMHRSWRAARTAFFGGGAQVPGRIVRWNSAWRQLGLAEAAAIRKRPVRCALSLADALWRDPVRSSLYLACRSARFTSKRFRPQPAPPARAFLDCSPDLPTAAGPGDGWLVAVAELDRRRMDALAALHVPSPLPDQALTPLVCHA